MHNSSFLCIFCIYYTIIGFYWQNRDAVNLIKSSLKKPKFKYKVCHKLQLTISYITKSFKHGFQHRVENFAFSTLSTAGKTLVSGDFSTFSTEFST